MKNILLTLALCFSLIGCKTMPEVKPSVVVEYRYVAAPIPEEALVIPAKIASIDLNTATQKEVAEWLALSEGRTIDLEQKLKSIKEFQTKKKEQESK